MFTHITHHIIALMESISSYIINITIITMKYLFQAAIHHHLTPIVLQVLLLAVHQVTIILLDRLLEELSLSYAL